MKIKALIVFLLLTSSFLSNAQSLNEYKITEDVFCNVLAPETAEIELYVHEDEGRSYHLSNASVVLYNERIDYHFRTNSNGNFSTVIEAGRYNLRINSNKEGFEEFIAEDIVFPSQRALSINAELTTIKVELVEGEILPPPPPPDPIEYYMFEPYYCNSSIGHNGIDSISLHKSIWSKSVHKDSTAIFCKFFDTKSKTFLSNLEIKVITNDLSYFYKTNDLGELSFVIDPTKMLRIEFKSYNNHYIPNSSYCNFNQRPKGKLQPIDFYISPDEMTMRKEDFLQLDSIRRPERYEYQEIREVMKPVIYLYPTTVTELDIQLKVQGKLTFSYPKHDGSWKCTAYPNGDIKIGERNYPYLFWEGNIKPIDPNIQKTGFVVKSEDIVEFLEEKLLYIGLNDKEMTDFITFWAPRLEQNAYSYLHFSIGEEYSKNIATLDMNVQPDSELHVHLFHSPVGPEFKVQSQDLPRFERKGFSLVEWGGGPIELTNN